MSDERSGLSKGIVIFAVLLLISSFIQIQKLIEASGTYYTEYFKSLPTWLMYTRYIFSWFQRAVGILVAVGLLVRKDIARKAGIALGIFAVSTMYWKHPYDAFQEHTRWLDEHYGTLLTNFGMTDIKFSSVTLQALIVQYFCDFIFWAIFIYFFTRPSVKAQFKSKV